MSADRETYIAGLRQLADLLEQHEELRAPWEGTENSPLTIWCEDKEQIQAWARLAPGPKSKVVDEGSRVYGFELHGQTGPIFWRAYVNRDEVCTARVVGTEPKTRKVAVAFEEVTEDIDVIEWDCGPLLSEATA